MSVIVAADQSMEMDFYDPSLSDSRNQNARKESEDSGIEMTVQTPQLAQSGKKRSRAEYEKGGSEGTPNREVCRSKPQIYHFRKRLIQYRVSMLLRSARALTAPRCQLPANA